MTTLRYSALRTRQTPESEWLLSMSAPATDIERWAGIPQKQQKSGEETLGFQRDENKSRIDERKQFYNDAKNIIQNPLLCAIRDASASKVVFTKTADGDSPLIEVGYVDIQVEEFDSLPLRDLLNRVKLSLEARITGLAGQTADPSLVADLKKRANLGTGDGADGDGTEAEAEPDEEAESATCEEHDPIKATRLVNRNHPANHVARRKGTGTFIARMR